MVNTPEQVLGRYQNRILPQWKICFASAVIVGFLTHFYKLTNWLPNWDSLVFRYDAQNMVALGRWFLPIVCAFSSFYDLPWLNGLLLLLFHALGAVCICKIFRIEKKNSAALIGAIVVSFPTVTSVLMYSYVADGYSIAFWFACLAAWFLTREKPNYAAAGILITLSTAIYQAYITVTILLLLLYLIDRLIYQRESTPSLIKKSLCFLGTGAVSMVLYQLILQLLLRLSGDQLSEYQGIQSAMQLSGIDLRASLYGIVHGFLKLFDMSQGVSVYSVLNCVIFAAAAIFYGMDAIRNKAFLPWHRGLLLAVYVICLPFGANILLLANSQLDYHNLMKMGYCVFYISFVLLYERSAFSGQKFLTAKAWGILLLCCALTANQMVIANVSYHKLQMAYEKSYGTLVRIADRIEQTEGTEDCEEILVIGALDGSEAYSVNLPPDMTGTTDSYILRADDETVGQSVLCSALNDYCGRQYGFVAGEKKQRMLESREIQDMPQWPQQGSIAVKEQVIVIKLGAERE